MFETQESVLHFETNMDVDASNVFTTVNNNNNSNNNNAYAFKNHYLHFQKCNDIKQFTDTKQH